MPGNPAEALIGRFHGRVSGQALHALEVAFGVNNHQSLISQYFDYMRNCFTGNFGISISFFPEIGRTRDHLGAALDARPRRRHDDPGVHGRHR